MKLLDVVKIGALVAGAFALSAGGGEVQKFLRVDPFAQLRSSQQEQPADLGFRLTNVALRQYSGPKLVARIDVDRLDVRKDRGQFELRGLKNGRYFGKDGQPVAFVGNSGTYSASQQFLWVNDYSTVSGKDFELQTASFTYDERKQLVHIPNRVTGKLMGGTIVADKFDYNAKTSSFEGGPIRWSGELTPLLQDDEKPKPTKWDIVAKYISSEGSKTNTNVYTEGQASDGEVIVQATKIEHNTKTDVLTATGKVRYFSPSANLVAEKVLIYRKEKRALLTGAVRMLVKPDKERDKPAKVEEIPPFAPVVPEDIKAARPEPAPSEEEKKQNEELRKPKTLRDYPMAITATQIEYFYQKGKRRAIVTGTPMARQELSGQKWRQVWAFKADYDLESEKLRLDSSPGKKDTRMKNSIGDDLVAKWLEFSTKEDDDSYSGEDMTGAFVTDDEDIPKDRGTKPPEKGKKDPPPTKPKGGGGLSGRIG